MAHPQHLGEPASRFGLAQAEEIGGKGNGVAATCIDGEVGPAPGPKVDAEAANVAIFAAWVPGDVLVAAAATIRQPAGTKLGKAGKGSPSEGCKVDWVLDLHKRLV